MIKREKIEIQLGETGIIFSQGECKSYFAYKNIAKIQSDERELFILLDSGSGINLQLGRDFLDQESKHQMFFDIIRAKENFYKKG